MELYLSPQTLTQPYKEGRCWWKLKKQADSWCADIGARKYKVFRSDKTGKFLGTVKSEAIVMWLCTKHAKAIEDAGYSLIAT